MPKRWNISGFTLVELTIVLIIVSLLIGGLAVSLTAQIDTANIKETQRRLEQAQEALLGFAAANGRLPCPAAAGSGTETFCTNGGPGACGAAIATVQSHGRCANPYDGFLPATTLGLAPADASGQLVDSWQSPVRYAVATQYDATNAIYSFTAPNGMKTTKLESLAPDLRVCATSATMDSVGTSSAKCHSDGTTNTLSNSTVAIVYSLGRNWSTGGSAGDEQHNPNPNTIITADRAFVSTVNTAAFDDIVSWLSPNVLYNRMITAGRLP